MLLGTPFFIVFGALSDRIGRKKIMMAGNLIAALTYYPIYKAMTHYGADPQQPEHGHAHAARVHPGDLRDDGVRPDRGVPVEAFPAKIRYTSLSLPYHIGNGWFGGFTPLIAGVLVGADGEHLRGTVLGDRGGADDVPGGDVRAQ